MKLGVVSSADDVPDEPAFATDCAAGCSVPLSCDSWVAVLEPDCPPLWATAAAWAGPAESLVVRGGGANGVSADALAEDAA